MAQNESDPIEVAMNRVVKYAAALGGGSYLNKLLSAIPSLYALWMMNESGGSTLVDRSGNGYNGTIGAGVVLGAAGPAVSGVAISFDAGANSLLNVYSAGFSSNFPYNTGSIFVWYKPDNWTAGTSVFRFTRDANNLFDIAKNNTNDRMQFYRYADSNYKVVAQSDGQSYVTWHLGIITWDTVADEFKAYDYTEARVGGQVGSTQSTIGTFVGNIASTGGVVGGTDTSTPSWVGDIGPMGIATTVLSSSQINAIMAG